MTTNRNYGKLENGILTYAPGSFKTKTGVIVNPPKEMYLAKGYYTIIDEKPEAESGCYVKFNGYLKDDDEKTITFEYVQVMIPVVQEVKTYSKLNLEMQMFQRGRSQEFDDFIDQQYVENSMGQKVSLRKFYDQAQELKSDNEYFQTYLQLAKEKMGFSDEEISEILNASLMDG